MAELSYEDIDPKYTDVSYEDIDPKYTQSDKAPIDYEAESKKFKEEYPAMLSPTSALQFGGRKSFEQHPLTTQIALTAPLMGFGLGSGLLNALTRIGAMGTAGTGLSQLDPNNKNSLLENAALNYGGNALFEGTGSLIGKGLNAFKNYAAPALFKSAVSGLQEPQAGKSAFDLAKGNHDIALSDENNKWNVAKGYASMADATPGINYNSQGYLKGLEDMRKDLLGKLKINPDSAEHQASLQFVHNLMDSAPESFSEALKHSQGLNEFYRSSIGNAKLPTKTVNRAIKLSKENIGNNMDSNNIGETVRSTFDDANKATQDRNQTFHQVITPKGKKASSTFSNILEQKNPNFDKESFINDYMPKPGEDIQKMQQFGKILGNEDFAKQTLRGKYFGKDLEPTKFFNKYNKLSEQQQNYLFSPTERSKLDSITTILKSNPDALKSPSTRDFAKSTLERLINTATAIATHGVSLLPSLAHEGVSRTIQPIANAIFKNPKAQKYVENSLLNPDTLGLTNKIRSASNPFAGPMAQEVYNQ